MKKVGITQRISLIIFTLILAVVIPGASFAATLAGWDVHGLPGGTNNFGSSPLAATTADSNLTVGGMTKGSGVGTTGSGAARAWGGNTWTAASGAAAVTANQYAVFTVAPNTGYQVSFSSVSKFDYRRSATGAPTGVLQYSLDGTTFNDIATLSYTSTSSSGASLSGIDLSTIPALQNISTGTTVTFRIVNYGGTSSSGTWYIFDVNNNASYSNDFEIQGTVSQVVTVVNGACGSDDGQTLAATAPSNLCTAGTASAVSGTGHPWSWTCGGSSGGSTASCSASIQTYTLTFNTDGNGTLSGVTSQTVDYGSSASSVTANVNGGYSFVDWTGDNGFAMTMANPLAVNNVAAGYTITANFSATPINGSCGDDNGQTLAATVPSNLCGLNGGTPSAVTGSGHPWNWTCAGANGGSTASCAANIQTYTLTFNTDGNGALTGASQTIDYGASASPVTANANSGYDFKNWSGTGGFTTTTGNPLAISNVTASQTFTANFKGGFTIFHVNDTHARLTPHWWVIPEHDTADSVFEQVGGAAYLAGEMLDLTAAQPNSIVIDGGDISEGNPLGDMNGNGSMTQFYTLLSGKLLAQRGRGMDALVVGNHDVRDSNYISNLVTLRNSGVPVISANVRDITTHQPYFAPYKIVTVNGTKIGILGYTTSASEVGASLANTLEVVACDWNTAGSPNPPSGTGCHLADYVNDLRNNQGCDVVILAAHIGHSAIVDPAAPLLVDNGAAKLPEVAVTGHWHTWTDTVWQPEMLNYKTIFTESSSYMKYIGELQVTGSGAYVSSVQHVIRDEDIVPDSDVQALIDNLTAQYNTAHPGHPVDEVIGYTADDLLLDNEMKWWSADEYPWSGNNSAGQWICDAMQWKAAQLFGQCDLSIEAGGGVRADIPAGPVTYMQIYETFPWNDDTFNRVNMTGQDIVNFLKTTNMDAGFSSALDVTANDGIPTSVKFNGQPIDLNHTYTVAINNYMYNHPPAGWTWPDASPLTSSVLCRDGIVDYMNSQHHDLAHAYTVGGERYHLNTEFSGGYRAVVTMMNDNDTKPSFDDAFIRLLSATPETLARRSSKQVPTDLVNADGTINAANRLSEEELYRSYMGFKTGALHPGDIIETWGKGSFYGGDPEFVDQEGIYSDGAEFKIVGHDESLAKPAFVSSIGDFWDDAHKNHYVQFLAKKTGTNTVADQYGRTISIMDVTGYTAKSLPGSTGGILRISGVPTMDSYAMRFRCDQATVDTTPLPLVTAVSSHLDPVPSVTTGPQLTLNATASVNAGTYFLAPLADSQIASGKPTTNSGTSTSMYVQSSNAGSYKNERSWLKFDLSGIPGGTNITGANLQLWDFGATGPAMQAEVRGGDSDSWIESGTGSINWSNQPTFGAPLATQTLTAGTKNVWYAWDVTSFVLTKFSGNKLISLVVKAATEDSAASPAPSYAFDAKEYGSNAPVLQITTQAGSVTVTQVEFFYRYSSDNLTWGAWTSMGTLTTAPYTMTFNYPQGAGYYEFYSQATDSNGDVEPAPASAQAATNYTNMPAYYPMVSVDNLYQNFDGAAKTVSVTTIPAGASYSVTYNGSADAPVYPGTYAVAATASYGGNTNTTAANLIIGKGIAAINLGSLNRIYDGSPKAASVTTTPSGLAYSLTYNGSSTVPVNVGTYAVVATLTEADYKGQTGGVLTIAPNTFTINASSGSNGSVNCTPNPVNNGSSSTCTISPNTGYDIATVTVDGSSQTPALSSYTFSNVQAMHTISATFADKTGPSLTVSTLSDGTWTPNGTLNVAGTATDDGSGLQGVTVNGSAVTITDGGFSTAVSLATGDNTITVIATDNAANHSNDTRSINYDPTAPVITIDQPADNSVTKDQPLTISGSVDENSRVTGVYNGETPVNFGFDQATRAFSANMPLSYGVNTIEVDAEDLAHNTSTEKRTVTYDNAAPSLSITDPAQDITTSEAALTISGEVSDLTHPAVTISVDGGSPETLTVTGGQFTKAVTFTEQKSYAFTVTATDEAGNSSTSVRNVIYLVDATPEPFTFTPQTDVAVNTVVTSNAITVTGINKAAQISITGGAYSINGGAYTSASGTVNNGDTVTVSQTSSWDPSAVTTATLTVGGVGGNFSVTTAQASGAGVPTFTLSPASLSFAAIKAGTTSAAKVVTIRNTGAGTLFVGNINITGSDSSAFTWSGNCAPMAKNATCALSVTFNAASPYGLKNAVLNISSNDPKKPAATVNLKGTSSAPVIARTPGALNFGATAAGSAPIVKTVTVSNKGLLSDLTVSNVTIDGADAGDFSQTNNCSTVPAQGTCTVSITFTPDKPFGLKSATLNISSDDPKRPLVNVKLAGKVAPPVISVPSALSFGNVAAGHASTAKVITIKNNGVSDLNISDISIDGADVSDFSKTGSCATIAAKSSCTISLTMTPTSAGSKAAQLTVLSDDPMKGSLSVSLTGKGL